MHKIVLKLAINIIIYNLNFITGIIFINQKLIGYLKITEREI